ncbi:hypothetical protein [Brevibacillus agri]|uniref:hypothetical protein n=1 Tax=Brevibacillus agri TaxID=51101 RepID=UPI002E1C2FA6|nr:hypothetical protein [Brevibacillus agri]
MKRKPMQGLLAAALLVTSLWTGTPAFANSIGQEIKIDVSQPEVSKDGFDISKEYAIWKIAGEQKLTLYNLSKQAETKIGDKNSDKKNPRVDGKYAVWIDSRHGGADVYLYDIAKDEEIRLTSGKAAAADLEISGKKVVWSDKSDAGTDIYMYDIATGDTTRVSTSGKASDPTVSDSYVAWEDSRDGNPDIYYYDIDKQKEELAAGGKAHQIEPSLFSDKIAYVNGQQVYVYTIGTGRNKQLTDTSTSKSGVHIYKDTIVYLDDDDLAYRDASKSSGKEIASSVFESVRPRIFEDYVMYAKRDNDKKLRLHIYDLDERADIGLGATSGEPSQPDGSDRYVVYVTESKKANSVVLFDTEKGTSKVISKSSADPIRPVVSGKYVVWYDQREDALVAYDIRKGTEKQITNEDDDQQPSEKLYEVDGSKLLWVNVDRRADLIITDLATGKEEEIASLKTEPLSVDIYGNYAAWVEETGSKKADIYLYDIEERDETVIRKNVEVQSAQIGDDFVVWSENSGGAKNGWDLYYYRIDRQRTELLIRYSERDQKNPQASRNMILFEDNRLSSKEKDFYYELYDVEDRSYSDVEWDDKAEISSPRIGGNRIVWIDERDGKPVVYTMAFASPRDDDAVEEPGTDPKPDPEPGDYREYKLVDLMLDGTLAEKMNSTDFTKIVFVFFQGTEDEITMPLIEAFNDSKRMVDLFNQAGLTTIDIRFYK